MCLGLIGSVVNAVRPGRPKPSLFQQRLDQNAEGARVLARELARRRADRMSYVETADGQDEMLNGGKNLGRTIKHLNFRVGGTLDEDQVKEIAKIEKILNHGRLLEDQIWVEDDGFDRLEAMLEEK